MNKARAKKVILAVVCMLAFSASTVLASTAVRSITVYYQDIKMYVDGQRVTTSAEPFIYNGSTYLPVRAVGEALGENVYWDGATNSVYVGERPGTTQYLLEVCPPYQSEATQYVNDGKYFLMAGNKYTNGLVSSIYDDKVYFNLHGKYQSMEFTYGPIDKAGFSGSGFVRFIGDGKELGTYSVSKGDMPQTASVFLSGVNQLIVEFSSTSAIAYGTIGVANIVVK